MAAKSTKSNSSGSVFYNVTATLDAVVTSALEMPMEAAAYADSVQDKLLGGYDTDVLADASASALAALEDKAGWMSLLA